MKHLTRSLTLVAAAGVLALSAPASTQSTTGIPPELTTPERVESRIGTLDFKDGAPSRATLDKVYDNLDFTYAFRAFTDTMQGVSIHALRKGLMSAGVKDNEVIVFSELMDAKSLFLTANADTIYAIGILDLTKGPMVLEVPPRFLGAIDDHWFRWVTDLGLPGADRGEGGKYLVLPPGHDGPLPEGGFFVARARTTRVAWFGRSFLENKSDPKPAAETIRKFTRVYPYEAGGVGTPIAEFLAGKARLGRLAVANASSRSLFMSPRDPSWFYYPGSAWMNYLFVTGYEFETPIPQITSEGAKPYPRTGYRTMDARTNFFYGITGITPGMAMRLTGIGSQYLFALVDANKQYFDGAKTYKVTLPKGIPEANFWSFTLYDNMTRSMLDTPQRFPRAGSQSYPSPAAEANADSSTTIYFGPNQPQGVKRGNWIQTTPSKGWFTILRLYSPLEPFFDRSWRPSEIELVR